MNDILEIVALNKIKLVTIFLYLKPRKIYIFITFEMRGTNLINI